MTKATDDSRRAVVALAERAGAAIAALYHQGETDVQRKADGTPLTDADLASETILGEGLRQLGDIPIASEETQAAPYVERQRWTRFWLVDPLDGTREFVNRTDEFAVAVALMDEGRPVLGVIHAPMLELTWSAVRGEGAFVHHIREQREDRLGPRTPPAVRTALVSRSHRSGGGTDRYLARFDVAATLPIGSAIKFGRMAEGLAHVYVRLGPTMEWDVAAGEIICAEQGLEVVRVPEGSPLDYNTESQINPPFVVRDPKDGWLRDLPAPD